MIKPSLAFAAVIAGIALLVSCRRPIPTAPDREAIVTTVSAFHDALAKGDRAAALSLLTPDAQILESGNRQTHAEYEAEHLAADIEFAQGVLTTQGALIVRQEGAVAWTTSTSRSTGKFRNKDVDSEGAELMVLARTDERWQIRAIHWSGHTHRPGD